MARDFHRPLSLAAIAREVHCSPFHLSRLHRRATGMTMHRTLVRLRLRAALERILDTRDSLSVIALDTGFSSHAHLSDTFRREYGASPDAVRRDARRTALGPMLTPGS
jgi:AraC-like DNA-binding protein